MEELQRQLQAAIKRIEELEKRPAFDPEALKRSLLDFPMGIGPYVSSSPTADGTISIMYRGQRYNFLVDKV